VGATSVILRRMGRVIFERSQRLLNVIGARTKNQLFIPHYVPVKRHVGETHLPVRRAVLYR